MSCPHPTAFFYKKTIGVGHCKVTKIFYLRDFLDTKKSLPELNCSLWQALQAECWEVLEYYVFVVQGH